MGYASDNFSVEAEAFLSSTEKQANQTCVPITINMQARIEAFNWSVTPLGPKAEWPDELRIIVQQILDSHFPKAIVWGEEYTIIHNDAFLQILGKKPEALGRPFSEIWAEVWDEISPMVAQAYAGISTFIEDYPLIIDRSGVPEDAWFTFCYSPLRLADGSVAGMLDTVVETTGKVRAQQDISLLNEELAHRLKNTLTVVQAIASQTLQGKAEPNALASFYNRLNALAQAHTVLILQNWDAVSLLNIVTASVEPHNANGQFMIEGEDRKIGSRCAVSLSLILNELATNAIKYGALSVAQGKVRLSWKSDATSWYFHWEEIGGPVVQEPVQTGFGSRLIGLGIGHGCVVNRTYDKDGFKFEMEAPPSALNT